MKNSFNKVCDTEFHGDFNAEISHENNKVRLTGEFNLPDPDYDYVIAPLEKLDDEMNSIHLDEEDGIRFKNYILTVFKPNLLMGSIDLCSSLKVDEIFDVEAETTHINIRTVKTFGQADERDDQIFIDLER